MTMPLDSATQISYKTGIFRQSESVYGRFFGHFSLRMRRIRIIYASGPKSVITVVLSDIDFLQRDGHFCDLTSVRVILATFYCTCAETAISQLPAKIMTTPLDSATQISYKRGYFSNRSTHSVLFAPFTQKSAIFLFPVCLT